MPHDRKKQKKKKKNGVPERWLDYRPVGRRIPGTRFIAFKVPLKPSLNSRVPESDAFCFWDLLDSLENQNQQLGLILDLTFTTRYYRLEDVPQSCSYIKIRTEGHQVPSDATILSFKRAVRRFLQENRDNDQLIGVHCTHGLNRTGYLICRYLIDVDGLDASAALELFNSSRGHCIERRNYLSDLQRGAKRSNGGMDEPEVAAVRGLAVERPQETAGERRPPGDDTRPKTPPGDHGRHRARHSRRSGQTVVRHGPQQSDPPPAPLLPTPPINSYIWSRLPPPPAPPPTAPGGTNRQTSETQTESSVPERIVSLKLL